MNNAKPDFHAPDVLFLTEVSDKRMGATMMVLTVTIILLSAFLAGTVTKLRASRAAAKVNAASKRPDSSPFPTIQVQSTEELIAFLGEHDMWEISSERTEIPLVPIISYPDDLERLGDPTQKKRAFLHALLPAAIVALNEVVVERETLISILAKLDSQNAGSDTFDPGGSWSQQLQPAEAAFIGSLTAKYRTASAMELLKRIDIVPLSMLLAQGAIESSWGSSRFARVGNNLFGIWTWGGNGIVPMHREEGLSHRAAAYDSILDSVRAYLLILNRVPVYDELRDLRACTMNPLVLADGLYSYSERGRDYIEDIKSLILSNKLTEYDRFLAQTGRRQLPAGIIAASELREITL